MRVMKSSGEGDLNITGDEHEEEVPGNEKKDGKKLDGVDAAHRGIVWPDKWPYNSHPAPKTFLNDWPYVDRYRRNIDYKPWPPAALKFNNEPPNLPALPEHPPRISSKFAASVGGSILMVLLVACRMWCCCRRIRSITRSPTPVVRPRAAQQHRQTHMPPPRQAEAVPPYIEMPPPYFECNNVSEEPPRGGKPLPHNNGLVEIGFRNECVAMTTTDNASGDVKRVFIADADGRIEERLSVNETAHGIRRADKRDNVMYVDEKSMPNQRAQYTK